MSTRSKILTWGMPLLGAGALLMGAGLVVQNRPVTPEESPPRQPTTAPSKSADIDASSFIGAIGTSEPPGEAIAIAAHTSGVVTQVLVGVGDPVAVGQALFTVETARVQAEIALREAELRVAESELASVRATVAPRRATIRSAVASLAAARADLLVAESERADRENLLGIATAVSDPRAIAKEEVDGRRFAVNQAVARVTAAQAAVERAEASVAEAEADLWRFIEPEGEADGPELRASAARVDQARRSLARGQADLDLLTVRSPVDGRVLQLNIRPGEYASASVPTEGLVVLGRDGPVYLRVEIDEVDIPRFSSDARAWASPRGDAQVRIALEFVAVEPLVVPKRNLAGRTSELVDTRVLQVVYALDGGFRSPGIGQQFDVYIEADGSGL